MASRGALHLWLIALAVTACPSPPAAVPPAPVGPAPLRRLTNSQYLNTLHDLFGPDAPPGLEDLPADATLGGFDGAAEGQQPSDVRVSRWQTIAQAWAERLTNDPARLASLLHCQAWDTPEAQQDCLDTFFASTGRLLFRRALTAAELDRYSARVAVWQLTTDFPGAVQLLLEAMLQAPQFLYRPELAQSFDGRSRATRLAMLAWDSAPDDELLTRAEHGQLTTPDEVRVQAKRLVADPRARRTWWNFHRQWLSLDRILLDEHQLRVSDPLWTPTTQRAALLETQRFVENVLAEDGTLEALLTSRRAWLDDETARLYGASVDPTGAVLLDPTQRAGVLTRIAFLASESHRGATSPPVRGNAVNLHLLCRAPTPPPPGIDTTPPMPDPGEATNRQLFAARTSPTLCAGCHLSLNGLGFGFEHYSASGAWQATDATLPVDAHGQLFGTDVDGPFDGALELSTALARSHLVQACAVKRWVTYALGRDPVEVEQPWVDSLIERFAASNGDEHALLVELMTARTMLEFPP